MKKHLSILIFLSLLFGCLTTPQSKYTDIQFQPSGTMIRAEIADTDYLRTRGLMHREHLEDGHGMLFVYEKKRQMVFWMANTNIPLDILFLDENRTIIDIQQMEPCTQNHTQDCKRYYSDGHALYAIELSRGSAKKHEIDVGDQANWN